MSFFSTSIGIDLGTSNTLIYVSGKGIVINEPSVVAIDVFDNKVMAVGREAKDMLGKTPQNINAIRPLQDGVIADFNVTKVLIKYFINKALDYKKFKKTKIVICVPVGVTSIEKKAVLEVAQDAGAKNVSLIEEPMAAAIGAGIDVSAAVGNMVVDIGGGTTEIAVISLGGIVVSDSLRIAGDAIDNEIKNYVKWKYKIDIGIVTAEKIKQEIGNACEDYYELEENKDKNRTMSVTGRDMVSGLPRAIELTCEEIRGAILETLNNIVAGVKRCLEKTPPELSSDIFGNGICLAGGGAHIKGFDIFMNKETGIIVNIAENSLNCVALGAGKLCENL